MVWVPLILMYDVVSLGDWSVTSLFIHFVVCMVNSRVSNSGMLVVSLLLRRVFDWLIVY